MAKTPTKQVKSEEKEAVSASKKDIKHKIVAKNEDVASEPTPFEVGDLHTKALLKLLFCHHSGQDLTYSELSAEIGVGEKTKRWQCEAWRDLKKNEYIVAATEAKKFRLSEKGVALAMTLASDEELADYKMPETNEEHHEKIKSKLMRQDKAKKYGPKIFQLMVDLRDDPPMTRHELAAKFNCLADSHAFFYGLQALKKMGLVEKVEGGSRAKLEKKKPKKESDEEAEGTGENDKKRSKRKREGGPPLKLTDKAFLATARTKHANDNTAGAVVKTEVEASSS